MYKYLYFCLLLLSFVVGAYVWSLSGREPVVVESQPAVEQKIEKKSMLASRVLYEINDNKITSADVEWEYKLRTHLLNEVEELTAIPDFGENSDQYLETLKDEIVSEIVERKVLYTFVLLDQKWNSNDPSRYSSCIEQWAAAIESEENNWFQEGDKERLKNRMCEKSLIDQYLDEVAFSSITVDETAALEFYKNHFTKFKAPEKVEIRQILVASEGDAKKVRARLTRQNFAAMAREHSIAPEANQGGYLGPFSKGEVPAVFNIAFRMREGQISDILKSTYGYHLVMLIKKHKSKESSFEASKTEIYQHLETRQKRERYASLVEKALVAINVSAPKPIW